ncbi:hypothetical protein BHU72_01265 [Desulfuribacillus stibiiarsenatis]|uniref:Uncharacterized protein n=1 Tax=Desulfuribacillus stibiiarsenatis TaxID=1390249 RepID=A0A1E5LA76_9FIRM|nr:hypothetical protein [Desulfuribacillus stibiiarsenatis]OEH86919.1 hypothetical protein BHU72_01265 [Desulfuribacillus stibiiarsenatis]
MNKVSWLKDVLENKVYRQTFFNNVMVKMTNPEARQFFAQMRDDEMRQIIILQQKIDTYTKAKNPVNISPFR